MGKNFQLAALEEREEQTVEYDDDGKPLVPSEFPEFFTLTTVDGDIERFDYHEPSTDVLALFIAAFADEDNQPVLISGLVHFLKDILSYDSNRRLWRRVRNPKDPVTIESLLEVVESLFEDVAARPTRPSSGSSSSRSTGGRTLTDHLPPKAQTRSSSRRAGSST